MPIARLEDIVWGAWDVFPDDAYVAASRAGVLEGGKHIEAVSEALRDIRPMPAAFERKYVRNLDAEHTMGDDRQARHARTRSARTSTGSAKRSRSTASS